MLCGTMPLTLEPARRRTPRYTSTARWRWALALLPLAAAVLAGTAPASAQPSAEELLDRAIAYHDPAGIWSTASLFFHLVESRPDGSSRKTTVEIDNRSGTFSFRRREKGVTAEGLLGPAGCETFLDGSAEIADSAREQWGLTCAAVERRRDYYTFLWGLPMKLRDPGTRLGATVEATTFDGREVWGLQVTYDPEVGADTWYLYFDRSTFALTGYRFYHDEAAGDGEYILLSEEAVVGSLRLPKQRTWYTHQGDELLGTDTLVSAELR